MSSIYWALLSDFYLFGSYLGYLELLSLFGRWKGGKGVGNISDKEWQGGGG